jgi:transposase
VLAAWLRWAAWCRIDAFVRLAKRIRHHLTGIHATLDSGLSNARVEGNNTHLRVLTLPLPKTSSALVAAGVGHDVRPCC